MKRSEALQPLSRDHFTALRAAKAVREATEPEAAAAAFGEFWEAESEHFRREEEILLPTWAANAEPDRDALLRTLTDHLHIRAQAMRLADGRLSLEEMHDLGLRLHDHVRFEERHLFPMIEQALSADQLRRLGAALAD